MGKIYNDNFNRKLLLILPSKCGSTTAEHVFGRFHHTHNGLGDPTLREINNQIKYLKHITKFPNWEKLYTSKYRPSSWDKEGFKIWMKKDFKIDVTCSVIRNPFHRMVSIYSYLKHRDISRHGSKILKKHADSLNFEDFVDYFVNEASKQPFSADIETEIKGFKPQIEYLIDEEGKVGIEFLLCCDNLEGDVEKMMSSNRWDKHLNSFSTSPINSSPHKPYSFYYNSKTIELVQQHEKGILDIYKFKDKFF